MPPITVYGILSNWQLPPGDKRIATHNGLPPTPGRWLVPPEDLDDFLGCLSEVEGPWAITEVVKKDAVTGMVFDVDMYLHEDSNMDDAATNYAEVLRDVLKTNTTTYDDFAGAPPEMWILRKPVGTDKGEKGFKCGFKIQMPLSRGTHEDNASIALAMNERFDEWRSGLEPLNEDFVDISIYKNLRWLMLGSVKEEQVGGGYRVWKVLRGLELDDVSTPTDQDPSPLYNLKEVEHSRKHLSRLSIPDDSRPINRVTDNTLPSANIGRPSPEVGLTDGTAEIAREKVEAPEGLVDFISTNAYLKILNMFLDLAPVQCIDQSWNWAKMMKLLKSVSKFELKGKKKRGKKDESESDDSDEDSDADEEIITPPPPSDNWATSIKYLGHVFTARSTKYTAGAEGIAFFERSWDRLKDGASNTLGKIGTLVVNWRAIVDPSLNLRLLIKLDRNLSSQEEILQRLIKEKERSRDALTQANKKGKKRKIEEALDKWRNAADEVAELAVSLQSELRPAILNYMSTFLTAVIIPAGTEIVSAMFEPQKRGGVTEQVMTKWIRRKKEGWKDYMACCGTLWKLWFTSDIPKCAMYDFDPQYQHKKGSMRMRRGDGNGVFNLFGGYRIDSIITPEEARRFKYDQVTVNSVLELLNILINDDPDLQKYVPAWIAAPLQHRGFRTGIMLVNTSIDKGVGKGLFWNCFLGTLIYGSGDRPFQHAPYGQIKDVNHVVGNFNEGLLMKVLLELDECGIFDGAFKQNQLLKGLLTELMLAINQKHMSLIMIKNLLNFILCTNKSDPIVVEPGDRRFVIFATMKKMTEQWYRTKASEILNDNTVKHFYSYLMQLDLTDFHKNSAPITIDKRFAMERNMPTGFRFIQAMYERLRELPDTKEIIEGTFCVHPVAFRDAFSQYCITYKLTDATEEATKETIKQYFNPLHKIPVSTAARVRYSGIQARPLIFPSIALAEAMMKSKGYWTFDMTGKEMEGDDSVIGTPILHGLELGGGVYTLK